MRESGTDGSTLGAPPSERGGRSNAVSADLSEIFSAVESLSASDGARESAVRALPARSGPPPEPRSRVGALGVAAAVVLTGAAIGILVTRKPAPPPPRPSAAPAVQALTVQVTPPPPAAPTAPGLRPTAEPEPVVQKAAEPLARTLPPLPPRPRPVTRDVPSGSSESALGIEGRALGRAAQTAASTGDPCAFLSSADRARCLFPAIDDADRRLRAAYELATDAGVPSRVLANYRQVWVDLRRRANREPYLVLDGYEALTDELNGYAADPGRFNG